jgi:hypothetical protein
MPREIGCAISGSRAHLDAAARERRWAVSAVRALGTKYRAARAPTNGRSVRTHC